MKYTILLSALFILTACGGGSGGNDNAPPIPPVSTPTPPPVPTPTTPTLFSKYNGVEIEAIVDPQSAHDIAFHITRVTDIAHMLSYTNDLRDSRFDNLSYDYPDAITEDCDSGQLLFDEEVQDDIIGFEYIECTTGPYELNGKGRLTALEFAANGEVTKGRLDFTDLEIETRQETYVLECSVLAILGGLTT